MQEMGTKLLQAALALHDKVATTFRKTAVNFHYEFTVRHLANVFQGLLMSTPEQFNNTTKLARLWLHESERVYADRLVTPAVRSPRLVGACGQAVQGWSEPGGVLIRSVANPGGVAAQLLTCMRANVAQQSLGHACSEFQGLGEQAKAGA